MLGRAPAGEDGDPHGVVGVVGVGVAGVVVVVWPGVAAPALKLPTVRVTVGPSFRLAPGRVLRDDDAVALLRVDRLLDDLDLEAVLRQPLDRVVLGLAGDVGDLDVLRRLGDRERDRRALVELWSRPGSASAPCPGPRCR